MVIAIVHLCKDLKLDFSISKDALDLLCFKIQTMEEIDKYSVLSYDEMWISEVNIFIMIKIPVKSLDM